MGCRCCRMIKGYIYDPSAVVEVGKSDSSGSSLYQPQRFSGNAPGRCSDKQKEGLHNLGYSKSNDGTLKLEVDNNHVNRLHEVGAPSRRAAPTLAPADGGLYIIQPQGPGLRWSVQEQGPSQVPVYPDMPDYGSPSPCEWLTGAGGRHDEGGQSLSKSSWEMSVGDGCGAGSDGLSADEMDEGVGGTPDYPCDTGDEGSALSVDINTSTNSMSSADTTDGRRRPHQTPDVSTTESGISVMRSEDEEEEEEERGNERREEEDVRSVTDSMVAEALAALEAATAGEEDFE